MYKLYQKTLLLASLLLLLSGLSSQSVMQAQEAITPLQLAGIERVGNVVISSDGAYIAFTRSIPKDPREENAPASSELHIMNVSTGEIEHIELSGSVRGLAQRPGTGTFTMVTSMEDDDVNGLYELNPATGDVAHLFSHDSNMSAYVWNHQGEQIGFMASEQLDLPENPLPYQSTIFEENQRQRLGFVADLSANNPEGEQLQADGSYYIMQWSPDGTRIAASVAPTPNVDDFYMFQQVHVFDAATGEHLNEINNEGKISQIEWSPNGQHLALLAGHDIHDTIAGRIMVVEADGGMPENIHEDFLGKYEQIMWTGDDTIHFIASEGVWTSFGTIAPDGSDMTRVIETGGPIMNSFSVSENGHIAFAAETPEHPSELYLLEAGSDELDRKTNSNPWLADVALGEQEIVTYPARDGMMIEGLLIHPYNKDSSMSYPMITVVHGGPEAHYSNGWLTDYSDPGQLMAARGYAVFYPNYRGSTGRGRAFATVSQSDLAGAEFDDIVDGVDYVIDTGLADADRIGVTGGSYGGYATAWMSTYYSDRFAAGVMFVGISNNLSKWGTSDIPEELFLVHSRERLWNHWEEYLLRSPIYYVEQAETPLLIMHGAQDTRVHPAQSLELHRHIKVRKPELPLRLVFFPGEGHGNRSATAQLDYNLRMIRWFDTYLKGDEGADEPLPPTYLDYNSFGITFD